MRPFLSIFLLQMRSMSRSFALPALCAFSAAWTAAFPRLARNAAPGDAFRTDALYSLGIVFAVVMVSLVAAAAGSLAIDRERGRLQLASVRPAGRFALAAGRIAALAVCAALSLGVSCAVLAARHGNSMRCFHIYRPLLEDPSAKALKMYDEYMASSPEFREGAKKAGKREILRYLARYAMEEYETVAPGGKARWDFPDVPADAGETFARVRFAESFGRVENCSGRFSFRGMAGNIADAAPGEMRIPLAGARTDAGRTLEFENTGRKGVTFIPRTGLAVATDAGGFAANLSRCWIVMTATVCVAIACGVFLGATLGRSVAVFAAMALLAAAAVSPAIMDEAPDPLSASAADRLSLKFTALAETATAPLNAFSPISTLAAGDCVEWRDVARSSFAGFLAYPFVFSLLAGFAIPRKPRG